MAQCYILLTLASIAALSTCLQLRPHCSQLGKYAMPSSDQRMVLFTGVEALAPSKDVGLKIVYECALEGMGGLILESPEKPYNCAQSLGIFPLIFEIDEGTDVNAANNAAIKHWENHIPNLRGRSGFGCNYIKEQGKHRYICLFK
ncbi:hypothetical protein Y032_0015g2877 [Ancylostoma ceylanicum]|uniref:SCP domain-containing protein n=1 Tax=Ancylostoma ceylanicum TaxID=53326 RepID=A0A016VA10_9BILA|nr:hypothetical protein Y032_0015g2877 [Ancylostoma ceylanicum]